MTTWPEATKHDALDQLRNGTTLADVHRATGVPKPTLTRWAQAAGIEQRSTEKTSAAAAATVAKWAELRAIMADEAGTAARDLLALVRDAMASGNLEVTSVHQAKDAATTAAILIDKAQLLTGAATDRLDHLGLQGQVLDQAAGNAPHLRAVS